LLAAAAAKMPPRLQRRVQLHTFLLLLLVVVCDCCRIALTCRWASIATNARGRGTSAAVSAAERGGRGRSLAAGGLLGWLRVRDVNKRHYTTYNITQVRS
jgi:hypothetical protein